MYFQMSDPPIHVFYGDQDTFCLKRITLLSLNGGGHLNRMMDGLMSGVAVVATGYLDNLKREA